MAPIRTSPHVLPLRTVEEMTALLRRMRDEAPTGATDTPSPTWRRELHRELRRTHLALLAVPAAEQVEPAEGWMTPRVEGVSRARRGWRRRRTP